MNIKTPLTKMVVVIPKNFILRPARKTPTALAIDQLMLFIDPNDALILEVKPCCIAASSITSIAILPRLKKAKAIIAKIKIP